MDGTLYRGAEVLPGAAEFIDFVKQNQYLLMTNCPLQSSKRLSEKLLGMGIDVHPSNIIHSGQVALKALASMSVKSLYIIGSSDLKQLALAQGITLSEETPEAVLVGYDNALIQSDTEVALRLLEKGIPGYCTNIDRYVPRGAGIVPHTGVLVEYLEERTGCKIVNLGKPQRNFIDYACSRFGCGMDQLCIIGDNLETDIAMGHHHGVTTYLVLTGISDGKDFGEIKPTQVFSNLRELMAFEKEG